MKNLQIPLYLFLTLLICTPQFSLAQTSNNWKPFKEDGKWGYKDANGTVKIPAQFPFSDVSHFIEGLAYITVDNKKENTLDPYSGDGEDWGSNKDSKTRYGILNDKGKVILSPNYKEILPFKGQYTIAKSAGENIFINRKGEIIKNYSPVKRLLADCYLAKKGEDYFVLNKNLKPIHSKPIDSLPKHFYPGRADSYDDYYLIFARGGQQGVFDLKAEKTLNLPPFDQVDEVRGGLITGLYKNKSVGYLPSGKKHMEFQPDYMIVSFLDQGGMILISSRSSNKVGYASSEGKIVVPVEYKPIKPFLYYPFGKRHVRLNKNGKVVIVSRQGKELIPLRYDEVKGEGATVAVRAGDKWALFDTKKGKLLTDLKYETLDPAGINFFYAKKDGKWGVIKSDGSVAVPFKFTVLKENNGSGGGWGDFSTTDNTCPFEKPYFGIACFEQEGKYGFVNTKGEIIAEPIYKEKSDFESGYCILFNGQTSKMLYTDGTIINESISKKKYPNLFQDKDITTISNGLDKSWVIRKDGRVLYEVNSACSQDLGSCLRLDDKQRFIFKRSCNRYYLIKRVMSIDGNIIGESLGYNAYYYYDEFKDIILIRDLRNPLIEKVVMKDGKWLGR